MGRRRPGLVSELLPVALVLASVAGTLALVIVVHQRASVARRPRPTAPPQAILAPMPEPAREAPKPVDPLPQVVVIPSVPKPPPEDPTKKAVARIESSIRNEKNAAEAADRQAEALEKARRVAVTDSERWKRREALVRGQIAALEETAESLEKQANEYALQRDALLKERDASKAALEKAKASGGGYAVLPHRGANGTWQRPVVIECRNGMAILRPRGLTFTMLDMSPLMGTRASPLVGAVARELLKIQDGASPDGAPVVPYIYFIVRPDGVRPYYEARARLEPLGIAFGYELVDQDWVIDFPDADTWDANGPKLAETNNSPSRSGASGSGPASGTGGSARGKDYVWPADRPGSGPGVGKDDSRNAFLWPRGGPSAGTEAKGIAGGLLSGGSGPGAPGRDPDPRGVAGGLDLPGSRDGDGSGVTDLSPADLAELVARLRSDQGSPIRNHEGIDISPLIAPYLQGGDGADAFARGNPSVLAGSGSGSRPLETRGGGRLGALAGTSGVAAPGGSSGATGSRGVGNGASPGAAGSPTDPAGSLGIELAEEGATGSKTADRGGQLREGSSPGGQPPGLRPVRPDGLPGFDSPGSLAGKPPAGTVSGWESVAEELRGSSGAGNGSTLDGQLPPNLSRSTLKALRALAAGRNPGARTPSNPDRVPIDPAQLSALEDENDEKPPLPPTGLRLGAGNANGPRSPNSGRSEEGRDASTGSSASPSSGMGVPMPMAAMNRDGSPGERRPKAKGTAPEKPATAVEVPLEIVVACGRDGLTIHPGGYRLSLSALKKDRGLVRDLETIAINHALIDSQVRPRPRLQFLIEPGGADTYEEARKQTVLSGLTWPVTLRVAESSAPTLFAKERLR